MSTHESVIQKIGAGRSRVFPRLLEQVSEAYPRKPKWWKYGVAIHIACERANKGSLEYIR